jgi:hypothetical protein
MTTLSQATAAPAPLQLAGRTFLLSPLTLRDYGTIEQAMLADRNAAEYLADEIDVAPPITAAEMAAWMYGPGLHYTLWLTLRREHAGIPLEECRELAASEADVWQIAVALDGASGLPPGNVRRQAHPTSRTTTRLAA